MRERGRNVILMAITMVCLCTSVVVAGSLNARELTDTRISQAVGEHLLSQEGVPYDRIDVSTTDGTVTLSGTVETLLSKRLAEEVAMSVRGVKQVTNEIEVELAQRDDAAIETDVLRALRDDPGVESHVLSISVVDGIVSLSGTVDSQQARRLTRLVAGSVAGVKHVDSRIHLSADQKRPDSEIEAEVRDMLRWDARVDDALVAVSVDNGVVRLAGTAPSAREKTRAIANAWVRGVEAVKADDLEVARWARLEEVRGDKYRRVTDSEVEGAVERVLRYEPRVQGFPLTVGVRDGIVTLQGTVPSLLAKLAAEDAARNVVGAWQVRNLLKVRPVEPLTDEEVRQNVERAIRQDPVVDSTQVAVHVRDNEIHLRGTVDSELERERVVSAAQRARGAVRVKDRLEVAGATGPKKPDWEIRNDIEKHLFWSPFVNENDVEVTMDQGVATLTGAVATLRENELAEEAARAGGAIAVRNKLEVIHGPGRRSES